MNRKLSLLTGAALIVAMFFGGFGIASAAVTISASTIAGETATIDMTDFDVSADGLLVFASDGAGDQITATGANADYQFLVLDAATTDVTNTAGLFDIAVDAGNAAVDVF